MSTNEPILSGFVSIAAVAAEFGLHTRTLKRWKVRCYGPPPINIGKRIYYRRADIVAWLDALGAPQKKGRAHGR